MLQVNDPAPDFTLENQNHETVSLSAFRDRATVVLYFYPKDDTPGCTIEARQFTALADEFAAIGVHVIGISQDDCASHQAFSEKYGLSVELLADTDGEACRAYGVWQEKEKNGEKKMGIVRSTFIIDRSGKLIDVRYGVSPDGHAQAILEQLQQQLTA